VQTRCCLLAIEPACGDINDKGLPLISGQLRAPQQIINFEENQARGERGASISVDKRMVATKVKQICRGYLNFT